MSDRYEGRPVVREYSIPCIEGDHQTCVGDGADDLEGVWIVCPCDCHGRAAPAPDWIPGIQPSNAIPIGMNTATITTSWVYWED